MESFETINFGEISVYNYLKKVENDNNVLLSKKIKEIFSTRIDSEIPTEVKQLLKQIVKNEIDSIDQENYGLDFNNENYSFLSQLHISKQYTNHVYEEKDGSYSIYPNLNRDNYVFLDELTNYLVFNNKKISESFQESSNIIKKYNDNMYQKLLKGKLNTYYGNEKYLAERVATINNGMLFLMNDNISDKDKKRVKLLFDEVSPLISTFMDVIRLEQSKDNYDKLVSIYKTLLSVEEELSTISEKLWINYMEENNIRFVHSLSENVVPSDQMDKICATVSSKENFVAPYGNIGYEYNMKMDHIYCISPEDAGSWVVSKEEFIKDGVAINWQYDSTGLYYEFGGHSKLLTPSYVYSQAKNMDAKYCYTEVVINNKDKSIKPECAFYTDQATEEEISAISEIANKEGIKLEKRTNKKRRNV